MEGTPAPLMLNAAGAQPAPVTEGKCLISGGQETGMLFPQQHASPKAWCSSGSAAQTLAGASRDIRECQSSCSSQSLMLKDQKKKRNVYFLLTQRSLANAVSLCVVQLC